MLGQYKLGPSNIMNKKRRKGNWGNKTRKTTRKREAHWLREIYLVAG